MANEFIARRGLIVLNNGAKITGSLGVSSDSIFTGPVTASSGVTGSFTGLFSGDGSQLTGVTATGTVSASSQIDHNATTNYVANEHIDHSTVNITAGSGLTGGGNITTSRTLTLDTGSTHFTSGVKEKLNADGVFSSSIQVDITGTTGYSTFSSSLATVDATQQTSINALNAATSSYAINSTIQSQLAGVVSSSAQVKPLLPNGTVSSSGQVDITATTGYATFSSSLATVDQTQQAVIDALNSVSGSYATTASNSFTGIQTIEDTTNSTNYTNGALVVDGGVGIAKDVNISGSLTVTGLFTAVSMSTQYVTSSQYTVGTSRIILNDDDLVRFAGLSIIDSGSTAASGSILWDSLKNHFIYETDDIHNGNVDPHSALIIAGPETYNDVGDEIGLVEGRVPIATSDHNIDNRPQSSSIRIISTTLETHIEQGLYVSGSISSSVGFSGDGSNLTGIVTNLNLIGSEGGTGSVSLKTQSLTIDGENGIAATVSGQTLTISGSNATTTAKGVAAFTGSNFTVDGGNVAARPINFNGADINLGGTHSFGLQNITPYGAATADQVTLGGGAIIHGVLFTTGSNLDVDTGTEVVATVATGSYDAAFFDYVIKKSTNYRAGTVMAVWDGSDNVEFTDTSTNDLGNTSDVVFAVDALAGNARLKAVVTSDDWIIKTAVRAL